MASNNLFLGTAKGSVGDITFYRRDGKQIARARIRNPKNPQTTGQAVQRNFMAPVSRFLSPLSLILETAWEGLNRAQSLNKLTGENVKLARRNGWYLERGEGWYPMPYIVSHGTIAPYPYVQDMSTDSRYFFKIGDATLVNGSAPGTIDGSIGQWSQALIADGYNQGDQVTIIVAQADGVGGYYPWATRFIIDPSDITPIADLGEGLIEIFYEEDTNDITIGTDTDPVDGMSVYGAAVIISRYENGVWRRSTQQMVVHSSILSAITSEEQMRRAIASYRAASSAPISDVYLNQGANAPAGFRYIGEYSQGGEGGSLYLKSVGSKRIAVDAAGTLADVLTVSGVRVSDGQLISDLVVVTDSPAVGHSGIVLVTQSASGAAYAAGSIASPLLRNAGGTANASITIGDGYAENAYRFLIAQGVPASALADPAPSPDASEIDGGLFYKIPYEGSDVILRCTNELESNAIAFDMFQSNTGGVYVWLGSGVETIEFTGGVQSVKTAIAAILSQAWGVQVYIESPTVVPSVASEPISIVIP